MSRAGQNVLAAGWQRAANRPPDSNRHPGRLRLRDNLAWAGIGAAVYAACQWGAISLLAAVASPAEVGRYALAIAIAVPIYALTGCQLRAFAGTDVAGEFTAGSYIAARSLASVMAVAVVLLVAVCVGFSSMHTATVVLAAGAMRGAESLSDVVYGVLQRHRRLDTYAASAAFRGVMIVVLLPGAMWLTGSLFAAVLAVAAGWGLCAVAFDLRQVARIEPVHIRLGPPVRRLLKKTWSMGLTMLLGAVTISAPRYMLGWYAGESAVGIFSVLFYAITAMLLMAVVVSQAVSPRLAEAAQAGRGKFLRVLGITTATVTIAGLAVVAAGCTVGRTLLALLYSSEYASQTAVWTLVLVAGVIAAVGCVVDYGLIVLRAAGLRLAVNAAALVAVTVGCFVMVPRMGLIGAAVAYLVSTVVTVLGNVTGIALVAADTPSPAEVPKPESRTGPDRTTRKEAA